MSLCWVLPPERETQVLTWARMPRAIWDSLCIPHRIAVVQEWFNDEAEHCHERIH